MITPGPWTWVSSDAGPEDEWGCTTPGPIDPETFVSKGYYANPELIGANGETVLTAGCGEYTPYKNKADARLIAVAPRLLASLTWLVEVVMTGDNQNLRKAIAQAEQDIADAKG